MKTQIIQLEPHDDAISVRDKMGWSQTSRIVLVWPGRGQLLDRRLDLVLLLRHSQSLGVQIALVTDDREVKYQAKLLGISVYKSVRKAQKARWKRPIRKKMPISPEGDDAQERRLKIHDFLSNPLHREREIPSLPPAVRIGFFILGVLAVFSIAAVLIPSANITITPETRRQEINLQVQANESADKVSLTGIFPIRKISTTVEGRGRIKTSGSVNIPTGYASGVANLTNLTDQVVIIPAGTVVSTPDSELRFSTGRDFRLAAGPGKEIEIPIAAILPGSAYNLPPGSINAIEGELGVSLTVENLTSTRGGSASRSPAPTNDDRTELKEQLISTLTQNARLEIQASLDPDDILLSEDPTLVNVLSETYYPVEFEPASELELILRLEFEAPYVSAADQESLALGILDANLPAGYYPIPGTMTFNELTDPHLNDGSSARWRMQLRRDIQSEISTSQAINLALGRSRENAAQRLTTELALSSPPHIETNPPWWPVMPFIPLRITIIPAGGERTSAVIQPLILN